MYCLRCKKITDTDDIKFTITRNNKNMKRGTCHVCGLIKTQFVKQDAVGEGIMNRLINKLPFEVHLPGHNFTGPGTKLSKRLNKDGTPKSWSKPINTLPAKDGDLRLSASNACLPDGMCVFHIHLLQTTYVHIARCAIQLERRMFPIILV